MAAITSPARGHIFKNQLLEKLTKSSARVTITFYSALIVSFFYISTRYSSLSFWETIGLVVAGVIIWTFLEYIFHRYILQIHKYIPLLKSVYYIFHGVHEENPRDQERLFMPPLLGLIIAALVTGLIFIFLQWEAFALMAGISCGYIFYCYVHYMVHTRPSKLYFHKLWIHHLKHHHKYPDKAFGVSSPLWDIIFGTMPPENPTGTRQFSR